MIRYSTTLLSALILGLAVGACASGPERNPRPDPPPLGDRPKDPVPEGEVPKPSLLDPNRIVARVNEKIITVRSLRARYGAAIKQLGETGEAQIRQILDRFTSELIAEWLFLEAAERMGVGVSREELERGIRERIAIIEERGGTLEEELAALGIPRWEWEKEIERELVTRKLYRMLIGRETPLNAETRALVDVWVRPAEVRSFYERNREKFRVEEEAQVDAIFVRFARYETDGRSGAAAREAAAAAARDLVARARAGEDFAKLRKEQHEKPLDAFSRPFRRGTQHPAVETFVWDPGTKVGDVSDPLDFPSGYLVLKLTKRQEERVLPFEEVRPQIEGYLRDATFALAQVQIQSELLRESVITPRKFKSRLKRHYQELIRKQLEILSR